ncbi:unnamed protein product [Amoebophrya sp. A120]|nr:unnamed protein product [Amoebophrya sp. A120]|eukprot:GSA120T00011428001.1
MAPGTQLILGRYEMVTGKAGFLGEGSFSFVQKGTDIQTGMVVAVKTFKMDVWAKNPSMNLEKFQKQIDILNLLMEPVDPNKIKYDYLKHPLFWQVNPKKAFLEMCAYSVQADGRPGIDAKDGVVYLITEKADYSMKDFIEERAKSGQPLDKATVAQLTKAFLIAMGILHAKNLTHLDVKPENIMASNGTWKIIDVDGCTDIDYKLYPGDASVAFSPIYCAPEWANFLVDPPGEYLPIVDKLDVWSTGISIAELVTLDVVLKNVFKEIMRACGDPNQCTFQFLAWLANPANAVPFVPEVQNFDPQFVDLVCVKMLTKRPAERWSLAQCMAHPFVANVEVPGLDVPTAEGAGTPAHLGGAMADNIKKKRNQRLQDSATDKPPMMKGMMFKLNSDGDKKNKDHWLKRDMWLSSKGDLCYFSQKQAKRLILMDRAHLSTANVIRLENGDCALPFAFMLDSVTNGTDHESHWFACETAESLQQWGAVLEHVIHNPDAVGALDAAFKAQLGIHQDFREFRMMIRNRRDKTSNKDDFKPVYEAQLWKLNHDGDPHNPSDWLQRRMWLAKNGSLCYHSAKENKDLMYYRPEDIRYIQFRKLYDNESCRPFSFEMTPRALEGVEYSPGIFAAEEEQVQTIIMGCIERYQKIKEEKEKNKRRGR